MPLPSPQVCIGIIDLYLKKRKEKNDGVLGSILNATGLDHDESIIANCNKAKDLFNNEPIDWINVIDTLAKYAEEASKLRVTRLLIKTPPSQLCETFFCIISYIVQTLGNDEKIVEQKLLLNTEVKRLQTLINREQSENFGIETAVLKSQRDPLLLKLSFLGDMNARIQCINEKLFPSHLTVLDPDERGNAHGFTLHVELPFCLQLKFHEIFYYKIHNGKPSLPFTDFEKEQRGELSSSMMLRGLGGSKAPTAAAAGQAGSGSALMHSVADVSLSVLGASPIVGTAPPPAASHGMR